MSRQLPFFSFQLGERQKSVADVNSGSQEGRGWVYILPNYSLIVYVGQTPNLSFLTGMMENCRKALPFSGQWED